MTCDRYKNALLNAAASEKLGTNLTRHLENCTGCSATLRTDRELFSRIDSALRPRENESDAVGYGCSVGAGSHRNDLSHSQCATTTSAGEFAASNHKRSAECRSNANSARRQ